MQPTNAIGFRGSRATRLLTAGLAFLGAVPWAMLAAGAPATLLLWIPAALVAMGFACAFLAVAVAALLGRRRTDLLLVGLAALSLITLLYAPALAMGGPIVGASESVVCPPGTGICWNYLHGAFKVQAAVLLAAVLLAAKTYLGGRASVA